MTLHEPRIVTFNVLERPWDEFIPVVPPHDTSLCFFFWKKTKKSILSFYRETPNSELDCPKVFPVYIKVVGVGVDNAEPEDCFHKHLLTEEL